MKHFTTSRLLQLRKKYGKEFVGAEEDFPEFQMLLDGASNIGVEQLANAKIRFLSKLAEGELVRRGIQTEKSDIWEHVTKRNPVEKSADYGNLNVDNAVYRERIKWPKWNVKVGPLMDAIIGGKLLRRRLPDFTKENHESAARYFYNEQKRAKGIWNTMIEKEHLRVFGKPFQITDYKISGIGRDEYSENVKNALRKWVRYASDVGAAADAHWMAAGHRKYMLKNREEVGAKQPHYKNPSRPNPAHLKAQARHYKTNRSNNIKIARAYIANRNSVERVKVTKDGEVHAYGTMPNTNKIGWYLAGYVNELAAMAQTEGTERSIDNPLPYPSIKRKIARAYIANRNSVERVKVTKDGEVHAYGTMPNTNKIGWYLAGYVNELAAMAQTEGTERSIDNPLPYPSIKRKIVTRPIFRFEIKTADGWQKVEGTVRSKIIAKATAIKLAAHYHKPVKVLTG